MTELPSIGERAPLLWAEEVEAETRLPERQEFVENGIKTIITFHKNDDDNTVKTTYKYKMETKQVSSLVARRRQFHKFGGAKDDPPGPNTANTSIGDTITINFIRSRGGELLELTKNQDDSLGKLIAQGGTSMIRCRHCKSPDHMTASCPYKDMLENLNEMPDSSTVAGEQGGDQRAKDAEEKMSKGTYVPPSLRSTQAASALSSRSTDQRRDDMTVRVTNLPDDATEDDLREIFNKAGRVQRIYLARDKISGRCKGFAFVTYSTREEAQSAIKVISKHRYDHLILQVEWAKQT